MSDGINVAEQLTLRWRIYPELSRWAQCNDKDASKWKREAGELERAHVRRLCLTLLTLKAEDWRRPKVGNVGSLPGEGKKTDAPLEPLEGTRPYQHLTFAQEDPLWACELKTIR